MRSVFLATTLLLTACGSSSSSSGSAAAPSAAAPSTAATAAPAVGVSVADVGSAVTGRVTGAPAGTIVHLVQPAPSALTLYEQAQTILDSREVDAEGRFQFAPEGEWLPGEVLVSAPGYALHRASLDGLDGELELTPEAICTVNLGASEEDAMALVLGSDGRVLAVPPAELVADASGTLQATRLPAGRYELLVGSGDGERFASASFSVAAGEHIRLNVTLVSDNDDDQLRFLKAVGDPELGAFLDEVVR